MSSSLSSRDLYKDEDDENDPYVQMIQFQSLRNKDGLEEAISVQWPNCRALNLSTLLEPSELAPLFDGAQWAGTRVWHAAICAIQYLQFSVKGKSLLELGCGLGVPGMVANQLGASLVYVTDQESIMSQLTKNVQANFDSNDSSSDRGDIHAVPLNWSREGTRDLLKQTKDGNFDICLNCDCIYEPLYGKSWQSLIQVIDELLIANRDTIVVTSVERRAADGINDFVEALMRLRSVEIVKKVFDDPNYKIEIYEARGKK